MFPSAVLVQTTVLRSDKDHLFNRLFLRSAPSGPLLLSRRCTEGIRGTGGGGVPLKTGTETGRLGVLGWGNPVEVDSCSS